MMYKVKEIYYTLQGEGFHTGRPSIFIRFTGCNLWTGLEKDRDAAICNWCDTDFVGTNGSNGGKYSAIEIKKIILDLWPKNQTSTPYVVCTGGEPLLQIDDDLVHIIHDAGFEIGLETNGTLMPPEGVDWICVSPKANTDLALIKGHELKVVYPQCGINPRVYENLNFEHFFIQPMDGDDQETTIKKSEEFVMKHPMWKLSLQTHKIMGIP
ncbi:MAG: 7-carboxy-7-deazaguanine synthase [Candidatus Marinimicrobia bacterium]|jgi:7-carboxy-7-deazaguanine synthase (Cx14CxxC type)|nr:7-carboxy-7-deazaguanine synthase [Candidatus Neomarinimicrobiota bacterium]|tara:strand:- start:10620 stop:11252 length:633 start_codon:yes stop_codon:yes gene_type:complete